MKSFTFHEFFAKMEDTFLGRKFSDMALVALSPKGDMSVVGMAITCRNDEDDPAMVIALLMVGIEATARKLNEDQKTSLAIAIREMAQNVEGGSGAA